MKCMESAGFLIPRPCRNAAIRQCAVCQKWICPEHTVRLPDGAEACASCAAERDVGPAAAYTSMHHYYAYDDSAFYWHGTRGAAYTESDYAAFEGGAQAGAPIERLDES